MSQTPLKAIRAKCLDCASNAKEVDLCAVKTCPLYNFRKGRQQGNSTIKAHKPDSDVFIAKTAKDKCKRKTDA